MKAIPVLLVVLFSAISLQTSSAKEPTNPLSSAPSTADLEAKFIAMMTNATFTGRWCGVNEGQLGPDKEDSYHIAGVTKVAGDSWQINVRMTYGGKSIDLPIPTKVQWAGDTPVLILDNVGMGGPRTYSARVLVYDNSYAGTWSALDHSGLVMGVITHGKN